MTEGTGDGAFAYEATDAVRVGHWHTYWTGPKAGPAPQVPRLRWLNPILVGGGEIVPTVRRVE